MGVITLKNSPCYQSSVKDFVSKKCWGRNFKNFLQSKIERRDKRCEMGRANDNELGLVKKDHCFIHLCQSISSQSLQSIWSSGLDKLLRKLCQPKIVLHIHLVCMDFLQPDVNYLVLWRKHKTNNYLHYCCQQNLWLMVFWMELIYFFWIGWENATEPCGNEANTTKTEMRFPINPSRGYFWERICRSYMLIYFTA